MLRLSRGRDKPGLGSSLGVGEGRTGPAKEVL